MAVEWSALVVVVVAVVVREGEEVRTASGGAAVQNRGPVGASEGAGGRSHSRCLADRRIATRGHRQHREDHLADILQKGETLWLK